MVEIVAKVARHRFEQLCPRHERQTPIRCARQWLCPRGWGVGQLPLKLWKKRLLETSAFDRVPRHQDRVGNLPAQLERAAGVVNPTLVELGGGRGRKCGFEARGPGG